MRPPGGPGPVHVPGGGHLASHGTVKLLSEGAVLARSSLPHIRGFWVGDHAAFTNSRRESPADANHSAAAGLGIASTFSPEPLAGVGVGSTLGALSVI
jgi:hypothetical protein